MKKLLLTLLILITFTACQPSVESICNEIDTTSFGTQECVELLSEECNLPEEDLCPLYKGTMHIRAALHTNDLSWCDGVEDKYYPELKASCVTNLASINLDATLCEAANDEINAGCKFRIPTVLDSITINDVPKRYVQSPTPININFTTTTKITQVPTEYGQTDRIDLSSLDPVECESLREINSRIRNPYAECIKKIAISTGDVTICDTYLDETNGEISCARSFAIEHSNVAGCFNLVDETTNEQEYPENPLDVAQPNRNDISQSKCLIDYITRERSIEGCGLIDEYAIGSKQAVSECYIGLAGDTRDEKWCNYIEDSLIDMCKAEIGKLS